MIKALIQRINRGVQRILRLLFTAIIDVSHLSEFLV